MIQKVVPKFLFSLAPERASRFFALTLQTTLTEVPGRSLLMQSSCKLSTRVTSKMLRKMVA